MGIFTDSEIKKIQEELQLLKEKKLFQDMVRLEAYEKQFLSDNDAVMLAPLHPIFKVMVRKTLVEAGHCGLKVGIFMGGRTFDVQAKLYAQGRKLVNGVWTVVDPKAIVTNAKPGYSWHQYFLACYDEQTEILTDVGWKKFSEIYSEDKVMVFKNGNLFYEKPIEYIEKKYVGEMIKIKTKSVDLMITPDHKCIIQKRFPLANGNPWSFIQAKDLSSNDILPCAGTGEFIYDNNISIKYPFSDIISSEDWWSFMGWYISEGFSCGTSDGVKRKHNGRYHVGICQKEGTLKYDKIWKLLQRLPFKFRKVGREFRTDKQALWSELFPLGNCYTKYIPRYLLRAPKKLLECLWESLIDGDGSRYTTHETYVTVSKKLANDVSELAVLLGKANSMYEVPAAGHVYTTLPQRDINSNAMQYCVATRQRKLHLLRDKDNVCPKESIDYKGIVYCVTTNAGSVVVRRNGRVVISGNCDIVMDGSDKPGFQPSWQDFIDNNKDKSNDWLQLGLIGKSFGMQWGGDFKAPAPVDAPHFQYHTGILEVETALAIYNAKGIDGVWAKIA